MDWKDRYKKPNALKRKNLHVFLLNEKENEAFENYCKKYKIENRSGFIRELLLTEIFERFEADYPTLFTEEEMNKMRRW